VTTFVATTTKVTPCYARTVGVHELRNTSLAHVLIALAIISMTYGKPGGADSEGLSSGFWPIRPSLMRATHSLESSA